MHMEEYEQSNTSSWYIVGVVTAYLEEFNLFSIDEKCDTLLIKKKCIQF